jgi:putative transposase
MFMLGGLYKAKVIHRRKAWESWQQVELATLEWVDWFNNRRLLGSIGSPATERKGTTLL